MKTIITRRSLLAASAASLLCAPAAMALGPAAPLTDAEALEKALRANLELTHTMLANKATGEPWTEGETKRLMAIIKQRSHLLKRLVKA